jgi:lipopolysaccharide/colanic/teichoic acid biosynthesis glycosyltransferase/O-antigen ligase
MHAYIDQLRHRLPARQQLAGVLTAFTPVALVLGRSPADIAISCVAALFFAECLVRRDWSWTRRPWAAALLLLCAYSVLRACFVPNIGDSVFAALVWVRYIVFAAGVATWALTEEIWRLWLIRTAATSALFLSFDAMLQYVAGVDILGHHSLDSGTRMTAVYTHPIVGMTIANLFILPLFWLLERKRALLSALFGGVTFIAVLLSGERMALLFACCVMLVWAAFLLRTHWKLWPLVIAGPCVLVILLSLRPDVFHRQVQTTAGVVGHVASSPYGLAWTSALKMGADYPLFGVGMRQFRNICVDERYGPLEDPVTHNLRCYVHPHNIYLEWFSEDGLLGLGGFIVCVVILFAAIRRRLMTQKNNVVLWGVGFALAVRLLPLFASTSFFNNWSAIPFWLCVGWALQGEDTTSVSITLGIKRLIDIAVASIVLIVLSPVMAATALAIRIKLGSPVLFCQPRPGKDEKLFMLYKFRSMTPPKEGEMPGKSDAGRLTKFGERLRASSLDELPELWNVLKGDMSLVGPRPLLPDYLPYYSAAQRSRHSMRPGLTGLAQINGRNLLMWDDRLALDTWYVGHWSLWLDLKIALATVDVVLSKQGISALGEATMPRFDDFVRARRQTGAAQNTGQ